jgi:hypothetical protein
MLAGVFLCALSILPVPVRLGACAFSPMRGEGPRLWRASATVATHIQAMVAAIAFDAGLIAFVAFGMVWALR